MISLKGVIERVSEDRIRQHIRALEGIRHPIANPLGLEAAARYITGIFRQLGYDLSRHTFFEDGVEYENIIPSRKGARLPDERVIVLAHYDSEEATPGADDNASAVAVMLELAMMLQPFTFARTIQFIAVTLEESKHHSQGHSTIARGSSALAAEARAREWNITGVIDLEMVAYAGDDVPQSAPSGMPFPLPSMGNFIGVVGNARSAQMVELFVNVIQQEKIPLPVVPLVVPGNGEILPDTRRSDHAPFWDRGYQAIMITDTSNFRNPYYHQPGDTLETLNIPFAANVGRATLALIAALAELP